MRYITSTYFGQMSTSGFSSLFPSQSYIVLDGGLGTTLEDVFKKDVSQTSLWSSQFIEDDPEVIVQAHLVFLHAGATIISTSTYQSSYHTFKASGYNIQDARRIMRKAVHLAHQARIQYITDTRGSSEPRIALSLGPFGAAISPAQEFDGCYPPPYGPKEYSEDDENINYYTADKEREALDSIDALTKFHLERLLVFAEDQMTWDMIDCIAFETVPLTREIQAIRRAMTILHRDHVTTKKPWWISHVFPAGVFPGKTPNGSTYDPQDLVDNALRQPRTSKLESIQELESPSALAINCTKVRFLSTIIERMSTTLENHAVRPWLVVYPNGGDVYDIIEKKWIPATESGSKGDGWAKSVTNVAELAMQKGWGGVIMGGCCRTGPREIAALSGELTKRESH